MRLLCLVSRMPMATASAIADIPVTYTYKALLQAGLRSPRESRASAIAFTLGHCATLFDISQQ